MLINAPSRADAKLSHPRPAPAGARRDARGAPGARAGAPPPCPAEGSRRVDPQSGHPDRHARDAGN